MGLIKQSEAQNIFKRAAESLRALSSENGVLRDKVATFEKQDRVVKLAKVMEDKNILPDLSFDEKIATFMGREDLDVVEQAVDLSANQVGLAKVAGGDDGNGVNTGQAEQAFIEAILEG